MLDLILSKVVIVMPSCGRFPSRHWNPTLWPYAETESACAQSVFECVQHICADFDAKLFTRDSPCTKQVFHSLLEVSLKCTRL